jgi:serine phosphatase RsbU (regulator of sigma subunit)
MILEAGADRAARLRLAIAGHPYPLHLSADGRPEPLGHPGILLGLRSKPGWRDASATLHPGETVVLYTDGVTEARRGEEFFGQERLEQVLPSLTHAPAAEVAERIATVAVDFQDGHARDDIAVIVVKATRAPDGR